MRKFHPHLEVITGPMFSGKTTELIRRIKRAEIAHLRTVLLRPKADTTKLTHDDLRAPHLYVGSYDELWDKGWSYDVVGIDEVQFFESAQVIMDLAVDRVVICAGLDTTFAYQPFGIVPELMAYAQNVDKLSAICVKCGHDATRTQRLINGKPASLKDPVILVGDEDFYEARCSDCFDLT